MRCRIVQNWNRLGTYTANAFSLHTLSQIVQQMANKLLHVLFPYKVSKITQHLKKKYTYLVFQIVDDLVQCPRGWVKVNPMKKTSSTHNISTRIRFYYSKLSLILYFSNRDLNNIKTSNFLCEQCQVELFS